MPSTHLSLHYHLVFITKNREAWFAPGLRPVCVRACTNTSDVEMLTLGLVEYDEKYLW